jgi:hypothetical protein
MPTNTPVGTLYRRAVKRVDRRAAIYRKAMHDHAQLALAHPMVMPDPAACIHCAPARDRLAEACRLANNLAQSLPARPAR